MSASEALDLALALHANPRQSIDLRARPLPAEGVATLLRLALPQPDALKEVVESTGLDEALLTDAARFFVEQQMLVQECEHDPWRVLGLPPGSGEGRLREHHRLLVRLVHPDRNSDWPPAFADRVNKAWRQLRRPEGRAEGIASGLSVGPLPAAAPGPMPVPVPDRFRPTFLREEQQGLVHAAPQSVRSLPLYVGGGIVVLAGALLLLDGWVTRRFGDVPPEGRLAASEAAPAPASSEVPRIDIPAPRLATPPAPALPQPVAAPLQADFRPAGPDSAAGPAASAPARMDALVPASSAAFAQRQSAQGQATAETEPASQMPAQTRRGDGPIATGAPSATIALARSTPNTARSTDAGASAPGAIDSNPVPEASRAAATAARVASSGDAGSRVANLPDERGDPVATAAQSKVPTQATTGEREVRQLLDRFVNRFRDGDLLGLLDLFVLEANQDEGGVPTLAAEYSRVFGATLSREVRFVGLHWREEQGRIRGGARFEARTRATDRSPRRVSSGQVEFEVLVQGQQVRFLRWVTTPTVGGA